MGGVGKSCDDHMINSQERSKALRKDYRKTREQIVQSSIFCDQCLKINNTINYYTKLITQKLRDLF